MSTQPDVVATEQLADTTPVADDSISLEFVDAQTRQLSLDDANDDTNDDEAEEAPELLQDDEDSNWHSSQQPDYSHLLPHLRPNKLGVFPLSSFMRKPMDPMMRLTHVLDMDGFFLRDKFYCKEAALIEVGNGRLFYEHFRLPFHRRDLLLFEREEVDWVTNAIHGIPFDNRENETLTQSELGVVIRSFLLQGFHKPQDIVVGYKGGTIERDLLDEMGIASFNMELIGCPKYDHLIGALEYKQLHEVFKAMDLPSIFCNLHIKTTTKETAHHCAKSEVCMFRRWYLHYYLGL